MRSALLVSSLAIANAYVATPSARMYRGLNYKTHEYEYGEADDRVRTLTSDDRVSVLEVLETDVVVKKRSVSDTDRMVYLVRLMLCYPT